MKIFRQITFSTIIIMFLTACHSQKDGTTQNDNTSNDTEISEQKESEAQSEQISFVMEDINGNQVSVKDVFSKNKITIIDFWASWCGPCRQEMPNLVNTYNKYKEQGLGIVGVSLDEDKEQWKDAVKEMNMTWIQLSDLKGWGNSAAQMYGIQAIPFTIIVDEKGNVLNIGLRGEALESFVHNYINSTK